MERLLPESFYSPDLLASRADQMVLADLVGQLVPRVHGHLEELGVDLASVTFGWFLSLFTDCLPVEVSTESSLERVLMGCRLCSGYGTCSSSRAGM